MKAHGAKKLRVPDLMPLQMIFARVLPVDGVFMVSGAVRVLQGCLCGVGAQRREWLL